MIVPRVRTPLPLAQLPLLIQNAGRTALGADPGAWRCRCAWAQLVEEHGRGEADGVEVLSGLFCFAFGNRDATAEERADPRVQLFVTVPEHEGDAASTLTETHTRVAYPDATSGLVAYWTAVLTRWPGVWDAMGSPDGPEAFAAALKSVRYYTADEAAYANALRRLWDEAAAGA